VVSPRIIHDEAWEAANEIVSALAPFLRTADVRDTHAVAYGRVKLAIERACFKQQNEARRIRPLRNRGSTVESGRSAESDAIQS
jgi:hypothetical protein